MANNVVARYRDGRVVKGTSLDVDPKRPNCHVRTSEGDMVEVQLTDLKALFFVRSLSGNAERKDAHDIAPSDPRLRGAHLVEIKFRDGERVTALAMRFPPPRAFFFLAPVDSAGNNLRILVNGAEVESSKLVESTGR